MLSLGAMGQGLGRFPGLFALRGVRSLVDSTYVRDLIKTCIRVRGSGKDFIYARYLGELFVDLVRFGKGVRRYSSCCC